MRKIILITAIAALLFNISCERDNPPYEGPSLIDLYGDFAILEPFEIADKVVDFEGGETTYFTAVFSKVADWEIHITGQESGAHKVISGTSQFLDETNSKWMGSTTDLPMFKEEFCSVDLVMPNDSVTVSDNLEIVSTKVNTGFLLADFEDGYNDDWVDFVQSGTDMSFEVRDAVPAAQGDFYFDMAGEVDWDWLISLIDIPASAYNSPTFPLSDNPGEVFFNIFLYKPEGINNELILLQFREDENGNGGFNENNEDLYAVELADLKTGWQHVSFKYSDLQNLVNGQPAAPNGNGIYEPHKILKVSILMLADPSSGYSQVYLDNIIFTEGGPLVP